jgi:hypothetical protein
VSNSNHNRINSNSNQRTNITNTAAATAAAVADDDDDEDDEDDEDARDGSSDVIINNDINGLGNKNNQKKNKSGDLRSIMQTIYSEPLATMFNFKHYLSVNDELKSVSCKVCADYIAKNPSWRNSISASLSGGPLLSSTTPHICTASCLKQAKNLRKVLEKHFEGPIHKLCAGQVNNYNNAEASGGLNTSIESLFNRQNKVQMSSWKQKCEALYFIIRHHIPPSRNAPAFDKLFTYMRTPGYDAFQAKNASYNSAYFYRELIQLIAVVLSEDIQKDVQKCNAYSIIVDETEDRSSYKSQLAILIRFFNMRTRCTDI